MNTIFKFLLRTSFVQSAVLKFISNAAVVAGAGLISLLEAHGLPDSVASQLGGQTTALVLLVLGLAWQVVDHYVVSGKIDLAETTLPAQLTQDQIQTLLAEHANPTTLPVQPSTVTTQPLPTVK